jgi:hypothetical protein
MAQRRHGVKYSVPGIPEGSVIAATDASATATPYACSATGEPKGGWSSSAPAFRYTGQVAIASGITIGENRMPAVRSNLARYVVIAAISLGLGAFVNRALGTPFSPSLPALYMLVLVYAFMHVVALSVVSLLRLFLSSKYRATVYVGLSISFFFLTSILVLNPVRIGGVHLITIFFGSLVIIASDYAWRAKRLGQREDALHE